MRSLKVSDMGQPIAHLQFIERAIGRLRFRWLPRGPVWAADVSNRQKCEVLQHLPEQFSARALWISTLEDPAQSRLFRQQGYSELLTPQYVAEIDLTSQQTDRLRAQKGKWRNRLRHAEKAGITVHQRALNPMQDGPLIALETTQRQDRRYSALPPALLDAWVASNPRATRIFLARRDGEVLAYLLLLLHAPVATYHIGWTGPDGRRVSAHNLLLWRASNWLAARGFARFDLGNVDTENTPGLARFKIGSGATIRPLGPTVLRLPRPRLFKQRQHAAA